MASVSNDPNGRRRILFFDANGDRRSMRLGKISKRQAETVKQHIEQIVAAQITRTAPPPETSHWLAELAEELLTKLADVGLARRRETVLLRPFLDGYVAGRTDLKPRTIIKFKATVAYLCEHFGSDRNVRDITAGEADQWRIFLIAKKMGENTVRKHAQIAKQFFTAAVRRKLIDANPFADLKSTVQSNPERFHFVTREDAQKVLDACPDNEWRLIFALSRYGGVRCPSETLALTWDCIDWEKDRIRIVSPKTAHHAGKASRVIPIFAELRPYLEAAFDSAEEGSVHVIQRYRDGNSNLRTQLNRIIERAGLKAWSKPFQNCRSTRQTELAEWLPPHVVCAWIGNSRAIAAKHYLQVTDQHYAAAARGPAAQFAAQSPAAGPRNDSHGGCGDEENSEELAMCGVSDGYQLAEEGLEPPTRGL
jgi:integrase